MRLKECVCVCEVKLSDFKNTRGMISPSEGGSHSSPWMVVPGFWAFRQCPYAGLFFESWM